MLWKFISLFLVFFLGNHLLQAWQFSVIPDIRTTRLVELSSEPEWFVFVVILKVGFFLAATCYLFYELRRLYLKYKSNK